MMEGYATEASRLAADFGVQLNYSESSLHDLELILAQLRTKLPKLSSDAAGNDPAQKEIHAAARIWGAYLGETIRRLWGGEWGVETYPGSDAPVISVDIGGAKLFPVMKVYRRLTQGDGENVWNFYELVRERVSKASSKQ
jgi:hypothetical protein